MQLPMFLDIKFESSIVQNFVVPKTNNFFFKGVLKEELSDMSLTPTIKPQSIDIVVANYNYLMHTIDKNALVMFMNLKR
jgi:hypothetical protein